MTKRILITGVTGFLGRHLTRALSSASDVTVFGITRAGVSDSPKLPCQLLHGDVTDPVWTQGAVSEARPTHCYHLAGQSRESTSWTKPWNTYEANIRGQLNLLESIAKVVPECRTLIASSSAVYGFMSRSALSESDPLRPVSPYGVSKAGQDLMARQYAISHSLQTVVTRNFNIIGPGQSPAFAFSSFASQVARAERGEQPPFLETGNLNIFRDFLDVQDLLKAWDLIMRKGKPGEVYNVGSGTQNELQAVVSKLLELAEVPMAIKTAPHRQRATSTDPPALRADIRKLQSLGPWQPEVHLDRTLANLLAYWRTQ